MLVISRKLGQKFYIGDNICVTVVDIDRGKIRLGIEAPREVPILRQELMPRPRQSDPAEEKCPDCGDLKSSWTFDAEGKQVAAMLCVSYGGSCNYWRPIRRADPVLSL